MFTYDMNIKENNILKNIVRNINLSKYYIVIVFNKPKSPYWNDLKSFCKLYFDTQEIEKNFVVLIKDIQNEIDNLKDISFKFNFLNWDSCSLFVNGQLIPNDSWKSCFLEHLFNKNLECLHKIEDVVFPCKEISSKLSYLNNTITVLDVINEPYYKKPNFCPFFKERLIKCKDVIIKNDNSNEILNIRTELNDNYLFSVYFTNPKHKNWQEIYNFCSDKLKYEKKDDTFIFYGKNNLDDLKVLKHIIDMTPYWRKIQILFNNKAVKKFRLNWLDCYIAHLENPHMPCGKIIKEYENFRSDYLAGDVAFLETPCCLFEDFCISTLQFQYSGVQNAYFLCPFFKQNKLLDKISKNFIENQKYIDK